MNAAVDVAGDFKIKTAMGFAGLAEQGHFGLAGGAVAFFYIATDAGSDHIFPGFTAASGTGNNVVEGEPFSAAIAAVLAGVMIPLEQVPTGEGNVFVGNSHVVAQANHGGQRKSGIDILAVVLELLGFVFN